MSGIECISKFGCSEREIRRLLSVVHRLFAAFLPQLCVVTKNDKEGENKNKN